MIEEGDNKSGSSYASVAPNREENVNPAEILRTVKARLECGKEKEAYGLLQRVFEQFADEPLILSYYGYLQAVVDKKYHSGIKNCTKALTLIKRKKTLESKSLLLPVFYLNLGRACLVAGMKREAIDAFQSGLQYDQIGAVFQEELRGLGVRHKPIAPFLGRSNPINKIFGKFVWRRKKGLEKNGGNDNPLHLGLACGAMPAGKDAKAAAALRFGDGMKQFGVGNYWGADEDFQAALRLDPENAKYALHRGAALSRIPRRGHEAEEYLLKAVEMAPNRADYHMELGRFYMRSGRYEHALSAFRDALKQDPRSASIMNAIKTVLLYKKNMKIQL